MTESNSDHARPTTVYLMVVAVLVALGVGVWITSSFVEALVSVGLGVVCGLVVVGAYALLYRRKDIPAKIKAMASIATAVGATAVALIQILGVVSVIQNPSTPPQPSVASTPSPTVPNSPTSTTTGPPKIGSATAAISPTTIKAGGTIQFVFTIEQLDGLATNVWLGASVVGPDGIEYFDVSEDVSVLVTPGTASYTRNLTISQTAPPGKYAVYGGIWFGAAVGPPSTQLKKIQLGPILTVAA